MTYSADEMLNHNCSKIFLKFLVYVLSLSIFYLICKFFKEFYVEFECLVLNCLNE